MLLALRSTRCTIRSTSVYLETKKRLEYRIRSCDDLRDARELHAQASASDPMRDETVFISNLIIEMYGRCGGVPEALDVFQGLHPKGSYSYSAVLTACIRNHRFADAERIFDEAPDANVVAGTIMISSHSSRGRLDEAKAAFDKITGRNDISWTSLVSCYTQNGHFVEARRCFHRMPYVTLVGFNAMLAAFPDYGHLHEAEAVFLKMPERDVISWTTMVDVYTQRGYLDRAKATFDAMPSGNVFSTTALLTGYAQNGYLEESKLLFDKMPEKNLVSWNAMLGGYACHGEAEQCTSFLNRMPKQDIFSWNVLLRGSQAKQTFDERMPWRDNVSWTALLASFSQRGKLDECKAAFYRMPRWDVACWNSLLAGYAQAGMVQGAFVKMREMLSEGFAPDLITFVCLLLACSHIGSVKHGWYYFTSMQSDFGLSPGRDHYCSMVDLLGRAGQLDDAEELLNTMPYVPNSMALLWACKHHKDVERARRVAESQLPGYRGMGSPYILISGVCSEDADY